MRRSLATSVASFAGPEAIVRARRSVESVLSRVSPFEDNSGEELELFITDIEAHNLPIAREDSEGTHVRFELENSPLPISGRTSASAIKHVAAEASEGCSPSWSHPVTLNLAKRFESGTHKMFIGVKDGRGAIVASAKVEGVCGSP